MDPSSQSDPSKEGQSVSGYLVELQKEFVRDLPDQLADLRNHWRETQANLEPSVLSEADRFTKSEHSDADFEKLFLGLHNLHGEALSFGFERLGRSAGALSETARKLRALKNLRQDQLDAVSWRLAELADLGKACSESELPGLSPQLDVTFEVQENGATDRPILVVDDDSATGQSIAQQLLPFGFAVHCLQNLDEFEEVLEQINPSAVIVDIMHPQGPLAGPVVLAELRRRVELSVPVIFVSARGDLEARLNACRAGGTSFFTKPIDFAALAEALEQATGRRAERRFEILIIDDDSRLAWSYAEILNRAGMSAMVLTDPMRTLEQLEKNQPDLILLDLYMPHCSGQELAAALRQHANYLSIPIVFLSSESDLDQQIFALGLGGDEFLTKPIHPSRLVATVLPRARRGRLLGTLLVRDGLTGLFNHSRLKERLEREILRAGRDASPLVLVMIDLDHFKQINDTYGHTVGDRVLCSLAAILRRRLRRTDTIARYGGDEFAVILPSTPADNAARIMTEIAESFTALELKVASSTVHATISWGLSELGKLRSSADLIEAADRALYQAKSQRIANPYESATRMMDEVPPPVTEGAPEPSDNPETPESSQSSSPEE